MSSPPITAAAVQAATTELGQKTCEQIEGETAIKWGARALAAWSLAQQMPPGSLLYMHWWKQSLAFKHESLEHAGWGPAGLVDALKAQLANVP